MSVNLQLPIEVEQSLRKQFGDGLEHQLLAGIAVYLFNTNQISSRQVGQILGMDWYAAQGFLKENGGELGQTFEEIMDEVKSYKETK